MFEIRVKEYFEAAHFLPDCGTKCANMHGHSWTVEVTIRSKNLENGMVLDFADVKKILKEILPDHCLLNDTIPNPTAENLVEHFFNKIKQKIPSLTKVEVWESTNAGAVYFED